MSDTIILDSKKCNAQLLTIHSDGRITVAEHLKPTETAAEVLRIMRETWMADAQSKKIRYQQERINRLEEAGDAIMKSLSCGCPHGDSVFHCQTCTNSWDAWHKAKEANP
jgi:hypothetical protein